MIRSFLIQFRYRELREDLSADRAKLKHLFQIVENPTKYSRVFLFVSTLMSGGIGAFWVVLVVCTIDRFDLIFDDWLAKASIACLILLSGIIHMLLVGWLPRALAPLFPYVVIRVASYYLSGIDFLVRPLVFIGGLLKKLIEMLGVKEVEAPETLDSDLQILTLGKDGRKFTQVTEKIAFKSLDLSEICVYDILLPRNQVQIFDIEDGVSANLEKARKTGHTRFPLCKDDLDHCMGIIHIKDIFRSRLPTETLEFEKLARPILRVDQEQRLDRVLQVLLQKRVHMALVEDEFGGILGVLTLERILEELVGEIQDEFDKEEKMIVGLKQDFYRISGLTPIHEVEDQLNLDDLENDEVSSFGGLITYHLGRIPEKGEVVEIGSLMITILETDETRVILTNVRVLSLPSGL